VSQVVFSAMAASASSVQYQPSGDREFSHCTHHTLIATPRTSVPPTTIGRGIRAPIPSHTLGGVEVPVEGRSSFLARRTPVSGGWAACSLRMSPARVTRPHVRGERPAGRCDRLVEPGAYTSSIGATGRRQFPSSAAPVRSTTRNDSSLCRLRSQILLNSAYRSVLRFPRRPASRGGCWFTVAIRLVIAAPAVESICRWGSIVKTFSADSYPGLSQRGSLCVAIVMAAVVIGGAGELLVSLQTI
jgi:hypothetical protein